MEQLSVPFKIYADFESVLKGLQKNDRSNGASYSKKYQEHIPCSFVYKVVCFDDRFRKSVAFDRRTNEFNKFIKEILKENEYYKKMIKNHFKENLVMSVEGERSLKSSNKCWICNELFTAKNNKVTDQDHVTVNLEVLLTGTVILILS